VDKNIRTSDYQRIRERKGGSKEKVAAGFSLRRLKIEDRERKIRKEVL